MRLKRISLNSCPTLRAISMLSIGLFALCLLPAPGWGEDDSPELAIGNTLPELSLPLAPDIIKTDDIPQDAPFISPGPSPQSPAITPPAAGQSTIPATVPATKMLQLDSVAVYRDYIQSIHQRLRTHWRPREIAGRAGGKTVVNFELDSLGQINHIEVAETSGNNRADDFAVQSIQQAGPFPEFPASLNMEKLVIQYTFDFYKPF